MLYFFETAKINVLLVTAGIICLILLTFTNGFNILVSMFEKYGGDPLKRSLKDQLITQFGCAMMLNNSVCTPCLSWRIIIGPLNVKIAVFQSFVENFSLTWLFLCLTESFVIKALMLFKFFHMAGLDETFMGRFFLILNLGFLFLTNGSR